MQKALLYHTTVFTDHFSGLGRAVGGVYECVCVCVSGQ